LADWAFSLPQPSPSILLSSSSEPASGTGTRRLRRRNPTAFSTEPFSFPEQGLQQRLSQRQRARNWEKSLDSVTLPKAILPASVALPGTSTRGERPAHSKMQRSPQQKTSALSHGSAMQKRAFECGKLATRSFRAARTPPIVATKLPESTWAVPGARRSPGKPSFGPWTCSLFQPDTYLRIEG
jgi:hypothetical protein